MTLKQLIWCREIVTGKPLPLLSKFRLSYYTLLNILRRLEGSGQSMEYVIARSFQQFQFEQSLPQVCWVVSLSLQYGSASKLCYMHSMALAMQTFWSALPYSADPLVRHQ